MTTSAMTWADLEPALSVRQVLSLERVLAGEPEVVAGAESARPARALGACRRGPRRRRDAHRRRDGPHHRGPARRRTSRPRPSTSAPCTARRPRPSSSDSGRAFPDAARRDAPGGRAVRPAHGGAASAVPLRRADRRGPVPARTAEVRGREPVRGRPHRPHRTDHRRRPAATAPRRDRQARGLSARRHQPRPSCPRHGGGAVGRRRRAARLGADLPPGRRQRGRRLGARRAGRARESAGDGSCCAGTAATPPPGGCSPTGPPRRSYSTACSAALRALLGGAVRAEPPHRPRLRSRTGPAAAAEGTRGRAPGQPPYVRPARRT